MNGEPEENWLSEKPDRVKFPYHVADAETRKQFEKKYAGRDDVPIFSDPRIVPAFHGVGPAVFATDDKSGEVRPLGRQFAHWLDQHPDRPWAMMMNYAGGSANRREGQQLFAKYRDRFVGSIAGESLGYFYPDEKQMQKATDAGKNPAAIGRSLHAADAWPATPRNIAKCSAGNSTPIRIKTSCPVCRTAISPLSPSVQPMGRADDRLRVVGLYVVAVADALGLHARRRPARGPNDRHLSLLQFRRCFDDFQQRRGAYIAAEHFRQLLFASTPARA